MWSKAQLGGRRMRLIDADLYEKVLLEENEELDKRIERRKGSNFFNEDIAITRLDARQNGLDTAINLLNAQPTVNQWIPVTERKPECEEEVWIQTERGTVTTAMYEDGKMSIDDSCWHWNDIEYDYDEENDIQYIPEGWWEYKHFAPDDVYNYEVDEKVIAWMQKPQPYKEEE